MPVYLASPRLLSPTGVIGLKSFKIDVGGVVTAYTPDWDTDPTFEITNQYGQVVIDRFGPHSIFQQDLEVNNPTAGNEVTMFSITEITLERIDNPNVVSSAITLSPALECILDVPASPGDVTAPTIISFSPTGTDISPSAQPSFDWSETVLRGTNKNIRLVDANTIGGTLTVVETLNTNTAPTSGAGSIAIVNNVTTTITPTSALPDGMRIAVLMDAGTFKDASNNASAAVSDSTYSFTVAAVEPPPPAPDGAILVGALTGSGVKVHPASSYSGSAHFALVGGFIETTAAGATADFNGSPYSITLDGQAATIVTVANGISVDSIATAHTARDTMQAGPTTDWTMILCSGVDFPLGSTWNVATAAMSGTWSHPDFTGFTVNKNPDNYTVDAETTITGGSITIKPSGNQSGHIYSNFTIHSNARVIFDGVINFSKYSTTRQWALTEPAINYNGTSTVVAPNRTIYQGTIGSGASTPTGAVVFKNGVDFGIGKLGLDPGFAVSVLSPNNMGFMSFEKGCRADGFIIFANFGNVRAYNVEDMECTRSAEDWMRCFNTRNMGTNPLQRRVVRSTLWKPYGFSATEPDLGVSWLSFHADGVQDKANSDAIPIGGFMADVLIYQTVDSANLNTRVASYFNGTGGKPNFGGVSGIQARGVQGMLIGNTTSSHVRTTKFKRLIIIGNTANGWDGQANDAVDCDNIIVFHDSLTLDARLANGWSTAGLYQFNPAGSQNSTYNDIVAHKYPFNITFPVGSTTTTMTNGTTGSLAPNALFAGTNGTGGGFVATSHTMGGNTFTGVGISGLDMSSVAAFRADIAARFTPRSDGALAGKVFLIP